MSASLNDTFRTSLRISEGPRVIVGLDFGTTFSGFSYTLRDDPEKTVYVLHEWPGAKKATASSYCKTSTSLWYTQSTENGSWKVNSWGWNAILDCSKESERKTKPGNSLQSESPGKSKLKSRLFQNQHTNESLLEAASGKLVSLFKLPLASRDSGLVIESYSNSQSLPEGISVDDAISDYLSEMSQFALVEIRRRFGKHISMADIQWALTVPTIWEERAKQRMKKCAELAGMIRGRAHSSTSRNRGSPHDLLIVLEPEAASLCCRTLECWKSAKLAVGDHFVVVDAGGGTVDLVGQEVVDGDATREVSQSTGGLCGGAFVDENFIELVAQRIRVLKYFARQNPASMIKLMRGWELAKRSFKGPSDVPTTFRLSDALSDAWKTDNIANDMPTDDNEELILPARDVAAIFDPIISQILSLIRGQLREVPRCKAIMLVGGFSASPYLQSRIASAFPKLVLIKPPNPGEVVCHGATLFALHSRPVVSRVMRRTYGIRVARNFEMSDDLAKLFFRNTADGTLSSPFLNKFDLTKQEALCYDVFCPFVVRGEEVGVDACVEHTCTPSFAQQTGFRIVLHSAEGTPKYTTDEKVVREGSFELHTEDTRRGMDRELSVSMYFGKTTVETRARGVNFEGSSPEASIVIPISFES